MRFVNILNAAAILAIASSTASAQGRIYSSGSGGGGSSSGGAGFTMGGHSQGGMAAAGGSGGGGAGISAGSPASPNGKNSGVPNSPRSFTSTPQAAVNHPNYIAEDKRRDRDGDRDFRNRHRRGDLRNHPFYPYYGYGYGYGYDYSSEPTDYNQPPQTANQYTEPEAPAPTIFENRPGYTPPPIRTYETSTPATPAAAHQNLSAKEPQAVTILVFRDGHEIEIGNYAIVGNTLYNLDGDYRTHKILLSDLDLDKTAKVNEARGYQFRLPRQQGS